MKFYKKFMNFTTNFFYTSFFVFVLLWLFICLKITLAQDLNHPKFKYQERENSLGQVDRLEGIKPISIAGENVVLQSVSVNMPDKKNKIRVEADISTYRIGFFLPEKSHVSVEVRDFDKFRPQNNFHYWMKPLHKEYASGFNEFSWDSTLVKALNIVPEDLGVILRMKHNQVIPAILQDSRFSNQIDLQGCRFIFVPNETMDLNYKLYPYDKESKILLEAKSEIWYKGLRRAIYWDGRDSKGKPASPGKFVLSMYAKVASASQSISKIAYVYVFYYTPRIELK